MTTTTVTGSYPLDSRFHRFIATASAFFEGINEGREMAARYDHLSKLSDADLARRGLARNQIVQLVVNGKTI